MVYPCNLYLHVICRFPPNERTTATGISSVFNQLGNAGGFLLGPLLVREPDLRQIVNNKTATSSVRLLRNDILNLMDAEALVCAILFFCVVFYFPSRPNLPPSVTSTVARLNIKDGVVQIFKYVFIASTKCVFFKYLLL